ncbi:TRAP-type transport system, small permease component, predicted N-acetylneuraminate transporter [Roseibacterium elongatum DSM 19469]|uniref:TRAP transporter small permease protein n=1 Tax=Roseicyclus elongatus DSM 19469 TaxID=1294273 RepID=W8S597_9RHOB|nr:TRAP transporter small permease subunit [Roseibacterium elongatum]AHM05397.1 TRAP-type transport system, small permease component, predicted N-acetylneuraminate transporter [Roseibacterium elongatum DSM 19469]
MLDFLLWVLQNFALAPYHLFLAITNPAAWLDWSNPEAVMRFIYYGASVEFFFVVFTTVIVITALGMAWKREILWTGVRILEGFANVVGRTAAWAGLLMVLIQVMIVFLQRIFRVAEIQLGPLGTAVAMDLSWWAEGLKFYNALVVCLCVSYTFVQGGHVRVDLVYSAVKHRTRRVIDMFGCIFFMLPVVVITYLYAWFFMWRHLMTPSVTSTSDLDRMLMQSRIFRWNVETIGFSPNGFNAYFLFKVLIVLFCVLVFLQAVAFFWRSYLEWVEGEESAGKYLDRDQIGDEAEEIEHAIHSGST